MYKRLKDIEKEQVIRRVLSGEKVSVVCRELHISRSIFYQWLKEYRVSLSLTKDKKQIHWRKFQTSLSRKIVTYSLSHTEASCLIIAQHFGVSVGFVWKILKQKGLNTEDLRLQHFSSYGVRQFLQTTASDKLVMMKRLESGDSVSQICRDFRISRTTFYKWLRRYKDTAKTSLQALESTRVCGVAHWRYMPEVRELIHTIVIDHPEYSPKDIRNFLLSEGKKTMSVSGIYLLLKQLDLNTSEKRLVYAKAHLAASNPVLQAPDWTLPVTPRYSFQSNLSPPEQRPLSALLMFVLLSACSFLLSISFLFIINIFVYAQSFLQVMGYLFCFISLAFGMFFFIYSLKYYLTIAIVLSYSRKEEGEKKSGLGGVLASIFGFSISIEDEKQEARSKNPAFAEAMAGRQGLAQSGVGLTADLSGVVLEREPFVSIHVSIYNEKRVIDRLLTAATSMEYENYEIIVADDSTDETVDLLERWKSHPRVKISHRDTRDGYKGQALAQALRITNPKAEFIMVFDADFIPYPDSITQFLKYFQKAAGGLDFARGDYRSGFRIQGSQKEDEFAVNSEQRTNNQIAAVQGYQWHVLNKSENWITRGVRAEYSGSYVIERSGSEVYGGLKQISGSVYMARRDVVEQIGWGRSITEDFEFTLRLYEAGYKVVYTPYIQAPAEAASTLKRLIRQRMRWAEGHSFNVKRMFGRLLWGRWMEGEEQYQISNEKEEKIFKKSPLSWVEKLEFVYLTPYYLQAAFFMVGTAAWFLAEAVFQTRLPFWTEVWGWSLVFTNLFALPLMNLVGLFMEESEEKDYLGLFSFVALSYIVAPFQAYAAVKGFLEKEEGPWFRTPKTGKITDTFMPGRVYRFVRGMLGKGNSKFIVHSSQFSVQSAKFGGVGYAGLATANNTFSSFKIRSRGSKYVANYVILLSILATSLLFLKADQVKEGTLADLPIATRVESLNHPSLSYKLSSLLTPERADASTATLSQVALHSFSSVSPQSFVLFSALVLLCSLSILVYLLRRKRKLFMQVMRGLLVFVLLLCTFAYNWLPFFSNGQTLFAPKQAAAQGLKSVQSNSATIASGNTSQTATITSVTTANAFLVFSVSVNSTAPNCAQIRGEITNSTTLTFFRQTGCATAATIQWRVAEFNSGVSVQRGTATTTNSTTTDVTISAVTLAHSFVLISMLTDGSNYDGNDFVRASLTSTTNLRLIQNNFSATLSEVSWQVISYTNSSVQTGTASFATGDTSKTATVSPLVDVAKSWLIYTYDYGASGTNFNDGIQLVRGVITNPTTLTFDRGSSGITSTVDYFVVEFNDATTVQQGSQNIANGTGTSNITLKTVNTSGAIAVGGSWYGRAGKTSGSANGLSNDGVTFNISSSTNLQLSRAATGTTIDVPWTVIVFNSSAMDQSAYRWFNNANSTDVGTTLAGLNTVPSNFISGNPLRLRVLVKISTADMNQFGQLYNLQVAAKGAGCASATYSDVATASGTIRFSGNSNPADGAGLTSNANDPTNSTTVKTQNYSESNVYTYNGQNPITTGQSGELDFSLTIPNTTANGNYCMRLVRQEDGSAIDTYTVYPEINVIPENFLVLFGMTPMLLVFLFWLRKKRKEYTERA